MVREALVDGAKERIMIRFYRLSLLVMLMSLASAVIAQEESNTAGGGDGFLDYGESPGLVVTASRTPEDAASAPAFVTVITADQIAESGASSVVDVLETVPGVRFTNGMAGPGSESVSMRGFGENSFGRVLVLVDGKRLNNPDMQAINWNAIPLAAIERIEVLDGSASVQYGNSAVGGVINIITKKTGERRTMLDVAGGSFFSNKASISHFEPVKWGNFSLTAEHTGTAGYRERQGAQVTNLTGGAAINITDALRLSADASFADLYYQLPGGLTKEEFEDDPTQAKSYGADNYDDENTERHIGGGLGLAFFPSDTLQINVPLSYMGKFIQSDMASYYTPSYSNRNTNAFEARPQVAVNIGIANMPLRLLGGVDFYFAGLGVETYGEKARENKISSASFTITQWTLGPYFTMRFDPLSILSISAGVRFDTVSVSAESEDSTVEDVKRSNALVYDAGIVVRPMRDLKIYAKYASLFRYPFVDELAVISEWGSKFNEKLDPEKGFNVEAGIAYQLSKLLEANVNFYYLIMQDEVYYDGTDNANMEDETRRIGATFGVKSQPVSFLEIEAGADWVNAVLLADDEPEIPLVPAFTLYAALTGKFPFGLRIGPSLEYRGPSYQGGDVANSEDKIDGYFLLGVSARYVFDKDARRFAVQCDIKNLLNTSHTSNVYWSTYYPGDGRTINVSLQYRF
jgi:iron complex outermembrane receptor protein